MKPLSILLAVLVLCCGSELSHASTQEPDQIRLADCEPITASNFTQVRRVYGVITDEELLWQLAWAPQGDSLAVAGETDVWLYDLAHLGVRQPLGIEKIEEDFRSYRRKILSMAYSPDGTLLAVGDAASRLSIWDAQSLEQIESFVVYETGVSGLAFNSDGTILASGGYLSTVHEDAAILLWDTETWTSRGVPFERESIEEVGAIGNLAFSPDDRLLAGSGNQRVVLFDVATQTQLPIPKSDVAWDVAFGHDGQLLAAATDTSRVDGLWLWDIEQQVLRDGLEPDYWITSVAFASDGIVIAIGMESFGNIYLWDTNASPNDPDKRTVLWTDEEQTVMDLAFSPDGKLLASVAGYALNLWGICEGAEPE